MLKSKTGTERSVQTATWAITAVAEALLIENKVATPCGLPRSCSKYGSSRVAAGSGAVLRTAAPASDEIAGASRQEMKRPSATRRIGAFITASNIRNAPFSGSTPPRGDGRARRAIRLPRGEEGGGSRDQTAPPGARHGETLVAPRLRGELLASLKVSYSAVEKFLQL